MKNMIASVWQRTKFACQKGRSIGSGTTAKGKDKSSSSVLVGLWPGWRCRGLGIGKRSGGKGSCQKGLGCQTLPGHPKNKPKRTKL